MFSSKNFTEVKTTVLGFLILAAAVAYPFVIAELNLWVFGLLMVVGISLLFLPDAFFRSLKKLIKTNSEKRF